jgi:hypothetical protein
VHKMHQQVASSMGKQDAQQRMLPTLAPRRLQTDEMPYPRMLQARGNELIAKMELQARGNELIAKMEPRLPVRQALEIKHEQQ